MAVARLADGVGRERDRRAEQFAEPRGGRGEGEGRVRARPWGGPGARRRSPCAPACERAWRWSAATARMRPSSVMAVAVERHVEVGADEHPLAGDAFGESSSIVFMCATPDAGHGSAMRGPIGRGTSNRARTALHRAARALSLTSWCLAARCDSELAADEDGQVDEAVGVAPLVVVPADDLDLRCPGPWSGSESKVQEAGQLTMSEETIGSSV